MIDTRINNMALCFVATDLTQADSVSEAPKVETMPDGTEESDITIDGKTYRYLSPTYYTWLRRQMEKARAHFNNRQIPAQRYNLLRDRFNQIHDLAVSLYGEEWLLQAIRTMTDEVAAGYIPPASTATAGRNAGAGGGNGERFISRRQKSARDLYAMAPGTLAPSDWQTVYAMMDNGTWNPPIPDITDPYAPAKSLALL